MFSLDWGDLEVRAVIALCEREARAKERSASLLADVTYASDLAENYANTAHFYTRLATDLKKSTVQPENSDPDQGEEDTPAEG